MAFKKQFLPDMGKDKQFGNMAKVNRGKTRHGKMDVPNESSGGPPMKKPKGKKFGGFPKMKFGSAKKFADGGPVPVSDELEGLRRSGPGTRPSGSFNSISSMLDEAPKPSATVADNTPTPPAPTEDRKAAFRREFNAARLAGKKEFEWTKPDGTKYMVAVKTKGEKPSGGASSGEKKSSSAKPFVKSDSPAAGSDRERYRNAGRTSKPFNAERVAKGRLEDDVKKVARSDWSGPRPATTVGTKPSMGLASLEHKTPFSSGVPKPSPERKPRPPGPAKKFDMNANNSTNPQQTHSTYKVPPWLAKEGIEKPKGFSKGGSVSRGDGCASKGKTKGSMR